MTRRYLATGWSRPFGGGYRACCWSSAISSSFIGESGNPLVRYIVKSLHGYMGCMVASEDGETGLAEVRRSATCLGNAGPHSFRDTVGFHGLRQGLCSEMIRMTTPRVSSKANERAWPNEPNSRQRMLKL